MFCRVSIFSFHLFFQLDQMSLSPHKNYPQENEFRKLENRLRYRMLKLIITLDFSLVIFDF